MAAQCSVRTTGRCKVNHRGATEEEPRGALVYFFLPWKQFCCFLPSNIQWKQVCMFSVAWTCGGVNFNARVWDVTLYIRRQQVSNFQNIIFKKILTYSNTVWQCLHLVFCLSPLVLSRFLGRRNQNASTGQIRKLAAAFAVSQTSSLGSLLPLATTLIRPQRDAFFPHRRATKLTIPLQAR